MEREIDLRPYCVFPEGCDDPQDQHEYFEATKGDPETAARWLAGLMRAGCTSEEELPVGYLEDPFVLGFAFAFCGAFRRDWQYEETDADFVREIFVCLFGGNRGAVLHGHILDLLGNAEPDFVRGCENGTHFHRAYSYPEDRGDDLLFAIAQRRAKEHMERCRKHIPSGYMYDLVFAKYRGPACYDVYFMDVLRERYSDKIEWRQSALDRLPNPDPDDLDWASLSEDELRAKLQQDDAVA